MSTTNVTRLLDARKIPYTVYERPPKNLARWKRLAS
jgi:precorrin-6x reductase